MGLYLCWGKCLFTGCVAVGIELIKYSLIHSVLLSFAALWHRSIIIQMGENALDGGPQRLSTSYDWDQIQYWLKSWISKLSFVLSGCDMVYRSKYFKPHYSCSVVWLAWLNVKGPMKQLSDCTLTSPFGVILHEIVCQEGMISNTCTCNLGLGNIDQIMYQKYLIPNTSILIVQQYCRDECWCFHKIFAQ